MVEHKIRNYKVLVNFAKDPSSSHFSGRPNECIGLYTEKTCACHRHNCIQSHSDTRSQARDLTHRKKTVWSVSYHGEHRSCSTLMGRCLIACC